MKRKLRIELSESRPFNSYYEATVHHIIYTQAYSFMFYYDYFKLCYYEESLCASCLFCNSRASAVPFLPFIIFLLLFTSVALHDCFHGNISASMNRNKKLCNCVMLMLFKPYYLLLFFLVSIFYLTV